jgi:general secretion pathway protein H
MRLAARGFTLIEILVVIFIIGLIAASVALSLSEEQGAYKEAQIFLQAVDFEAEYAALNGEVIGMFAEPRESQDGLLKQWCYHWKTLREGDWQDLPEDTLAEHCMEAGLQWDLVIEGKAYRYDPELEKQPPVLLFSPSGEATPVEMAIFTEGATSEAQRIEIDMMGTTHWRNEEDEEKRRAR